MSCLSSINLTPSVTNGQRQFASVDFIHTTHSTQPRSPPHTTLPYSTRLLTSAHPPSRLRRLASLRPLLNLCDERVGVGELAVVQLGVNESGL